MLQSTNTDQKAKFEFYVHLAVYLVVISGLVILNFKQGSDTLWVKWPAFGWGIGVLVHALRVFFYPKYME